MKNSLFILIALILTGTEGTVAAGPKEAENNFLTEFKNAIPQDRMVSVDDLYKKWQEVQAGTSKAVIVDIRTHDEFDAGHIKGSNNIDSGHAYQVPALWQDPGIEMWIFCRTQHRASYFGSLLYKYGYKNVYIVNGGIQSWAEKGYPLVTEYLGEIKVSKYEKKVKEDFLYREGH